jgi:hypothetical protein
MKASTKPISGENIIGSTTFSKTPPQSTAPGPALEMAAPMSPPTSAWEELEGMPKCQVMRFQAMAPMSAANTTVWVPYCVSMIPL